MARKKEFNLTLNSQELGIIHHALISMGLSLDENDKAQAELVKPVEQLRQKIRELQGYK